MDLYDELPLTDLLFDDEFTALLEASKRNQVSVIEFLTLSAKDLALLLQRSINEVVKFQGRLFGEFKAQLTLSSTIRPWKKDDSPKPFTCGDVSIDGVLGGGIFTRCITEIFGESSSGKSQFLMQLSLSVQLPTSMGGLAAKCVYITTEGDLPTQRLQELIASRSDFKNSGVTQNNIYTVCCNDLMAQEHILDVQLPILLEKAQSSIKLVIIDSIAHHIRVELTSTSFRDSQDNRFYIDKMAEKLLRLASKFSLAVVVANQVGDRPLIERAEPSVQALTDYEYQLGWLVGWKDSTIVYRQKYNEPLFADKANPSGGFSCENLLSDDEDSILIEEEYRKMRSSLDSANQSSGSKMGYQHDVKDKQPNFKSKIPKVNRKRNIDHRVPSLGLNWANHISTRILLSKTYKASPLVARGEMYLYKGSDPSTFWQVKRTLKVVFSTFSRPCEIPFLINKRGVEGV